MKMTKNVDILFINRGVVVEGRQLGRTIGFPTANISIESGCDPRYGVYTAAVKIADGRCFWGICNIGIKPTVESPEPLLEIHILGIDENLYGQCLCVVGLDYLRAERRFSGIPELTAQIHADLNNSATMISRRGSPGIVFDQVDLGRFE